LVMVFFAPVAAALIQLAVSRVREYNADELGAEILGDPLALARALERLEQANQERPLDMAVTLGHQFTVQPFRCRGLLGLFSTHPDVRLRVARLRQMALKPPAGETVGR
jgi:heat shock protein HtpX